jgi:hypothetical protein
VTRRRRIACTVALIVLGISPRARAAGEYKTVEIESLRITADSEWIGGAALGYLPIRWDITNLGGQREIEIAGDGNRILRSAYRYRDSRPAVRQRIRLARGDRVRFTMSVPVGGNIDNMRFQIRENGRTIQTLGFLGTSRFGGVSAVIVSARTGSYSGLASGWVRSTGGVGYFRGPGVPGGPPATVPAGGGPAGPPLDLVLEPSRLPTSWLGYTSVQAVVIGPREWEQMDAAQRSALLTWAACGGDLILADGELDVLFPDAAQRPGLSSRVAEHFFGRIHLLSSADIEGAGFGATLESIEKSVREPSWALPLRPIATGSSTSGFRLPIPGVDGVPAGAYLTLLTLFALLIGPVNHIVLRRRQQQALIVLTTPLIAAVFILLLGGYVVAIEGFGIRGRILSLTLLDQPKARAVTRATVSLYAAGRAPSGGLRFPRDVAVFPTPVEGALPIGEMLDLTELQQFASGLLDARSPSNFETLSSRAARERLVFTVANGRVRVSNGLGATVTRLRFRDRERSYALGEALRPGAAADLQETTTSGRELLGASDSVMARFDNVITHLAEGSYLAVVDRSPFWDSAAVTIDERGSFHAVLGRVGIIQ